MTAESTHRSRWADPNLRRVAAVVAAALLFALLTLLVRMRWLPMETVDHDLAADLNGWISGHPAAVRAMGFVSRLGSFGILGWLVVIAAVLLAVRQRYRLSAYLVVTGVGELILDPSLKRAIGRLRPVVEHPVAHGGGNSFPSGHAFGSIVGYGALLLVFAPALGRRSRPAVTAVLALVVAAIGFSRLALGVHFLSDVLGGWALGVAWLGLTAYAFELHRKGIGRRATHPVTEGLEPEAARDLTPAPVHRPAEGLFRPAAGLAIAWVLVFGLLCGVGLPLASYHAGNGNILGDHTIPHWFAAHRTPFWNEASYIGSQAGNTHMILAVGLIFGTLALAALRRWRPIVFLLVVMFGELSLFLSSAAIVGRARPDVPHLDGKLPTSSFPSGHVAATILLYASIVVIVWPHTRAWWRWLLAALAVAMPVWIALSRMYRGMHHPTDVLGSVLLAAVWLPAAVWLIRPALAAHPARRDLGGLLPSRQLRTAKTAAEA
jgi:undecaprenyl-diphosphatase